MAESIHRTDSIESSGFPMGFKVRHGSARPGVLGLKPSRDLFRVELRALGGHQKEAVVTEGATGSAYRSVCDEGAALKGTDLAPFPLGFFSAGLQADFLNRFIALATVNKLAVSDVTTELVNIYEFNGSFFRGDGKGSAEAPRIKLRVKTDASASAVQAVARAALDASPIIAICRAALGNTFALYVNGKRRMLRAPAPSNAPDAPDPLKTWTGIPRPLAGSEELAGMITKISDAPPPPASAPQFGMSVNPSATIKRAIDIRGIASIAGGTTLAETWAGSPVGSRFGLKSDERTDHDQAPSGMAIAAAGIAYCLTTQLLRYADVHKMNIRAIRMVQDSPFELVAGVGGTIKAVAHPFDTHVFLHGEDTDERMEKLLVMAQNTCYLHALLHGPFEPTLDIELNGARLAA